MMVDKWANDVNCKHPKFTDVMSNRLESGYGDVKEISEVTIGTGMLNNDKTSSDQYVLRWQRDGSSESSPHTTI